MLVNVVRVSINKDMVLTSLRRETHKIVSVHVVLVVFCFVFSTVLFDFYQWKTTK